MTKDEEERPATVSSERKTKQAGEARARWAWAEPSVWTLRMLAALAKGVKGGKWFSLIDKVYSKRNLESAFKKVKANKGAAGVDHQTIAMFEKDLERNLEHLHEALKSETYKAQAIRRCEIPKPGTKETRPLGIPTVRDRVVQTALRNVLEPIFEKDFAAHSYGFRPRKGAKEALRRVNKLLKEGFNFVVDADLKSYFDTIPHDPLMEQVMKKISDSRVLGLLRKFLAQEILSPTESWTPTRGSPQGAVVSPLLSNIYLDPLDQLGEREGLELVRYADDFVILCRTREEAERALGLIEAWTKSAGLSLHPKKTVLVDYKQGEGFDFLGYYFRNGRKTPRKKSLGKLKDVIRAKTRRANGRSLQAIIVNLNRSLRGWFEYFKHSETWVFKVLDSWIRMRLRSILRKRKGLEGKGRGSDHQRWKNAYFREQGLYFLVEARASAPARVERVEPALR